MGSNPDHKADAPVGSSRDRGNNPGRANNRVRASTLATVRLRPAMDRLRAMGLRREICRHRAGGLSRVLALPRAVFRRRALVRRCLSKVLGQDTRRGFSSQICRRRG